MSHDWVELCRAAVADVKAVLEQMPGREERERPVGFLMASKAEEAIEYER